MESKQLIPIGTTVQTTIALSGGQLTLPAWSVCKVIGPSPVQDEGEVTIQCASPDSSLFGSVWLAMPEQVRVAS